MYGRKGLGADHGDTEETVHGIRKKQSGICCCRMVPKDKRYSEGETGEGAEPEFKTNDQAGHDVLCGLPATGDHSGTTEGKDRKTELNTMG